METTAIVERVHPPRITKYGSKQKSYDLKVKLFDGSVSTMYKRILDGSFQQGSEINILYNPDSPHDNIYLK